MIVKVKREDGYWSYFEGDSVIINKIEKDDTIREETIYFTNLEKGGIKYIGLYITKEKKVINRLVTNLPTYLLNDNGKTIDKLI